MGEIAVLDPGSLTTIQDARGRPGLGRYGIPPGGAMDAFAARIANLLVGNEERAAVLEITMRGPRLRFGDPTHIALAGADLDARIDGLRVAPGHSVRAGAGAVIEFGVTIGGRAYLAVEGGFAIEPVLGSTSTDRRSGFGGFEGRALRAGDILRVPGEQGGPLRSATRAFEGAEEPDRPVLLVPTPRALGWFDAGSIRTLCRADWIVAPDSDRSGLRLIGAHVGSSVHAIRSVGVPVGAVQVPPSGEPIVSMVDGPVTGGYPVIGVVPRLEHGRLGQATPGTVLRFARVSVAAARRAAADIGSRPPEVEVEPGDFAAGWAR